MSLSLADLPSIDPARLALHNALHVARRPLGIDWHGRAVSLRLLPEGPRIDETWQIALRLGDEPLRLSGSARAFECLGQHPARRRALDEVDRELAAMWLEVVWLEWLEPLEAALGVDIRLLPATSVPSGRTLRVGFAFELDGESHSLALDLSMPAAEQLLPLFDRAFPADPSPAHGVMSTLRIESGEQTLTLGEWRSLRPGDVVMLETARADQVRLDLADRFGCHASFGEAGLHLSGPLAPGLSRLAGNTLREESVSNESLVGKQDMDKETVDKKMSSPRPEPDVDNQKAAGASPNAAAPASTGLDGANVDSLPVRLICEVGRLEMPLGELRKLGEGSVLPLQRQPEQAVDLVVNGQRMGRGRLVAIGDAIGVQIERLALDEGHAGDD